MFKSYVHVRRAHWMKQETISFRGRNTWQSRCRPSRVVTSACSEACSSSEERPAVAMILAQWRQKRYVVASWTWKGCCKENFSADWKYKKINHALKRQTISWKFINLTMIWRSRRISWRLLRPETLEQKTQRNPTSLKNRKDNQCMQKI